jgi:Rps23 Pro-64 3,4-dihydroxylase Tpa1-like proline 4-hydroxylase
MKRLPNDSVLTRTVTFNYYLTKGWQSQWGGNFVWEKPYAKITPTFNTLVMFLVSNDSIHHVEQVDSSGDSPRLAITGWFTTTRKPGEKKLNLSNK